jgi:hypothetical protein
MGNQRRHQPRRETTGTLIFRPPLTDKSGNWRYLISVFGTVFLVPGHTPRTVLRFYILNGRQNICYRGNN